MSTPKEIAANFAAHIGSDDPQYIKQIQDRLEQAIEEVSVIPKGKHLRILIKPDQSGSMTWDYRYEQMNGIEVLGAFEMVKNFIEIERSKLLAEK